MNQNKILPRREESDPSSHWCTTDIFTSDALWKSKFEAAEKRIPAMAQYIDMIGESAQALHNCLKDCDELSLAIDRLYIYAFLRFHEDSSNTFYQGLSDQAESLMIRFSGTIAYIIPEILAISPEILASYRKRIPALKTYDHFLENIQRQRSHTLTPKEESLLAKAAELSQAPSTIFTMLNEADIKFPQIKDENGEMTELTKARYSTFLESSDRSVRKAAFDALYETYEKQKNTLAATYSASVKADVFYAQARNYNSALAAALDDDNIPIEVYHTLISTVHKHLPLLHRYVDLRKKLLGLDELHMYDLYVPLLSDLKESYPYDKAKETVLHALKVMGKPYHDSLKNGLESGWIDIYENQGKRSGAYSWGVYGVHPYVLLNHNDTMHSMFTLAHEMGHALHSYYTWANQPYQYSGHKIFVAEVASTANEALLMEHLLKTTEDKAVKASLINHFLEQFRGTFFRQTMFAEFEYLTHTMAENGEPLTCQALNNIYRDLNQKYYGSAIVIDEHIDTEWARIPHFYNAFYVYQYATGYCAAIALSRKILSGDQSAITNYMDFLSKGNSEYSIDLLKGAGVDMTTAVPLVEAMVLFEDLLNQLEALV